MKVSIKGPITVEVASDAEKALLIFALNYAKDNAGSLSNDERVTLNEVAGSLNAMPSVG